MNRSALKTLSVAGVMTIALLLLPLALARSSNCGGNSAALSLCGSLASRIRIEQERFGAGFDVQRIDAEAFQDLTDIARSTWLERGTLWIRRTVPQQANSNVIVAVCTRAYDNVPQPLWWNGFKRTPAHAIAPLRGSSRLVSPAEFAQLDLSAFASVLSLTNSASPLAQ